MAMATITINGQTIKASSGATVLQAAQQAGIDIPTLCNHPALVPIGACRVCLVEVKGQRNLQPACTFPIMDGMEVETETPQLVKARKFILDMIFSERNHYCMYCEMSGKCELQDLGYRYGIDHWIYPTYTQAFPVDATNRYFLMEHNRCVLCSRCIRACAELPANHTLGLGQRGAKSMICADGDSPLADSTCVSCGSCVQVCPTGALLEKHSAFMGRNADMSYTKTVCSHCSVGCGMVVVTRSNAIQRIESDWDAPVNRGRLCKKGRFEPLYDSRKRLIHPSVRRNGRLMQTDWEDALQVVADRLKSTDGTALGVLASGNATNEALYFIHRLFRQALGVSHVGLLGVLPQATGMSGGKLDDIAEGDVILVIGADPAKDQPVASFLIKHAIDKGARLVVVDDGENGLSPFAWKTLPLADLKSALEIVGRAVRPVVLCGPALTDPMAKELLQGLPEKAAVIRLEAGINTQAARALGFLNDFQPGPLKGLYLLQGEDKLSGENLLTHLDPQAFLVLQASYASALTERADVVLPATIWSERDGTLTNTEGRIQKASKALEPMGEARADWEILASLADRLGKTFGTSFEDISAQAVRDIKGKEI